MPRNASSSGSNGTVAPFAGFALPTSNTTYTPNQFFDVCLPHYPRGVVRLVAYMIRKTLGWCDENGQPLAERHVVSYDDLERAGISRGIIKPTVDEAIEGHFITCVRKPQSSRAGSPGVSALYELKWDERPEYLKNPKAFRGFFAGEGNRTYIPNQFFDELVPNEALAVLKVVGSIIRFSIGYQNKWGHRRRNVALSYQHIRNYTRLSDRHVLSAAIQHAISSNFIERVEDGFFDPDGGRLSKAAVYALKWLNTTSVEVTGSKNPPAEIEAEKRFKNPTGNGSKTPQADLFKNPTGIEIKQTNKTFKQQEDVAAAFSKLRGQGFDAKAAQAIASTHSLERIDRQIQWLPLRKVRSNRLGMLRAAITEDWPEPAAGPRRKIGQPNLARTAGADFGAALREAKERLMGRSNSTTS